MMHCCSSPSLFTAPQQYNNYPYGFAASPHYQSYSNFLISFPFLLAFPFSSCPFFLVLVASHRRKSSVTCPLHAVRATLLRIILLPTICATHLYERVRTRSCKVRALVFGRNGLRLLSIFQYHRNDAVKVSEICGCGIHTVLEWLPYGGQHRKHVGLAIISVL